METTKYIKHFNESSCGDGEYDLVELVYILCCEIMEDKINNTPESLDLKNLNIRGLDLYLRRNNYLVRQILEYITKHNVAFYNNTLPINICTEMRVKAWLKEHVNDAQFVNKDSKTDVQLLGRACGEALGIITDEFTTVHQGVFMLARKAIAENNKPKCKLVNQEGKELLFELPETASGKEFLKILTSMANHLGFSIKE